MSAINLCLAIHEPYCLRRYTIFDIGESSVYEDDDRSCHMAMYYAKHCYLPTFDILYRLIKRYSGDFVFSLSISDSALDLFEQYTPEVLDNLRAMAETGCVEFIGEPGPHTLAFIYAKEEFIHQVNDHSKRIESLFGKMPTSFRNSELLYNNEIAQSIEQIGFTTILSEGAKEILGWRSPNFVYAASVAPSIRLLLRNPELSSNVSQRFSEKSWSEWPLTAEKYAEWLVGTSENSDCINLFFDCHAFGLRNRRRSGIFDFLENLPRAVFAHKPALSFMTPRHIVKKYDFKDSLTIPNLISWNDEGSDIRGWLGNEMQKDALTNVYQLSHRVRALNDAELLKDYTRLQTSDYFHYMSTRWFSESQPDRPNPYLSPYDAYISYMNMLKDFEHRLLLEEESKKKSQLEAEREDDKSPKTQVKSQAKRQGRGKVQAVSIDAMSGRLAARDDA
ncbi:MAG: glycoside hydrolase family 57 protein [Desulfovibrio sp.]|nr:glycoside hydrolase family 57 protein [Desulfovibrio sp.]